MTYDGRHLAAVPRRRPRPHAALGGQLHAASRQHPARRPRHGADLDRHRLRRLLPRRPRRGAHLERRPHRRQIQATATRSSPAAPGLIGRYGLNEGTGTTRSATPSHAGTLNGTPVSRARRPGSRATASRCPTPRRPRRADRRCRGTPGNDLVTLALDRRRDSDLAGYRVYRGDQSLPVAHDRHAAQRRGAHHARTSYTDTTAANGDDLPLRRRRRRQRRQPLGRLGAPRASRRRPRPARALALRRRQRPTSRSAPRRRAERCTTLHARDLVPAHGAGVGATTGTRRHRERDPARHQGPRRGRDARQRQHELLPRHRRRPSGVLVADFEEPATGRQPPGHRHRRRHAATSGTTPPPPTTARPGACTSTASSTHAGPGGRLHARGPRASSTPRSAPP